MPISIITGGSLTGTSVNGGDVLINFPGGVQTGDVVYACTGVDGTVALSSNGYTELQTGTSTNYNAKVWRKVMGASPDSSILFTGTGSATDGMAAVVYILRGVDTTSPEDATTPAATTGNSTNPDGPAITTVTRTAWVLSFASSDVNDTAVVEPTGYSGTLQATANDTRDSTTAVAYKQIDPAGVENPGAWTAWDTGTWVAITVAVRPAGFITVPVTGVSGTGAIGTVSTKLGVSITLTGVSCSGAVGSVSVKEGTNADVAGVETTGEVGDVSIKEGIGVEVLGVESTVELGEIYLIIPMAVSVTGVVGTGAIGDVTAISGQIARVTGVYCTAQVGTVAIWLGINDDETADWTPINDGQNPDWVEIPS